VNHKSTSDVQC